MIPINTSYEYENINLDNIPQDIPLNDQLIEDLNIVKHFTTDATVVRDNNNFLYLTAEIPSPNHDSRPDPDHIDALVMHYTAGNFYSTIKTFLEPKGQTSNPVSSHYVVSKGGVVIQMVNEDEQAWHAGISRWFGKYGMNSSAVGIEIVNDGFHVDDNNIITEWLEYTEQQKQVIPLLAKKIITQHNIPNHNIVGHQDIAPSRKQDPGRLFFWDLLAENDIGITASHITIPEDKNEVVCQAISNEERDHGEAVKALQIKLSKLGYTIECPINPNGIQPEPLSEIFDEGTVFAVNAFRSHFVQDQQIPDPRQGHQATWDTLCDMRADYIISQYV